MNYIIKNYNLKEIALSNNYRVYSFILNKQKYALRIISNRASARNRLKKTYLLLKYLNKEGLKSCETPYYLDKSHRYLITGYIEGKEMGLNDLKDKELELFIKELVKLNNFKINLKELKIINPLEFKKRALRKANLLKKEPIALSVIKHLKTLKIKKDDSQKLFFDHGDLAGANIFLTKKQGFKFIDWDNAHLSNNLSLMLAKMFYYASYFDYNKQEFFIKLYFQEAKLAYNPKEFREELNKNFKLVVLSAIIWALKVSIKDLKYKEIAKERLKFFRQLP